MKKTTKLALVALVALIVAAVPLYYYTRPDTAQVDAVQIEGSVGNPTELTLSQLQGYTATSLQVTLSSSSRPTDNGVFTYTGVPLKDLLDAAQVWSNATSVYIQASDGYGATIPLTDAMNPNTIIAYERDGAPLTSLKDDGEGPLRLIIGNDQYAQRWVRGVVAIEVN
jgi:DMSO/TMAO reductase YedYZ molybdopterin-dependent catalytic subunit